MTRPTPDSPASGIAAAMPAMQAPGSKMRTPPATRIVAALPALSLAMVLAAGLASTLHAVGSGRLELLSGPVTRAAFLDGQTMRGIADALARAPQPRLAADAARAANWLLLRDLGPQVRQGCPGWLFLADELTPHEGAADHMAQRAAMVAQVHQALGRDGIRLLVAVVPDKSRVAHTHLCSLQRGTALQGRVAAWAALLQDAGVPMLDLDATLAAMQAHGEGAFFRTDTHWTEDGAQRAAEAVALAVRAHGWSPEPVQEYDAVREAPAARPGDLVRLAGIDKLPTRWQPAPETARAARFTQRSAAEEDDLFGDAQLPRTVLMGTSFSRTSGFAGFLAGALHTPVVNFGRDGGNFSGGAAAYFQDPAWRQTPPRLVIWEIPERTLQRPIAATERAEWRALPGGSPGD